MPAANGHFYVKSVNFTSTHKQLIQQIRAFTQRREESATRTSIKHERKLK